MYACFVTGIVNKVLSFKGWSPFSRLTYCVYLLHPIIIRSISSYSETSNHYEFLPFVSIRILKILILIYNIIILFVLCVQVVLYIGSRCDRLFLRVPIVFNS